MLSKSVFVQLLQILTIAYLCVTLCRVVCYDILLVLLVLSTTDAALEKPQFDIILIKLDSINLHTETIFKIRLRSWHLAQHKHTHTHNTWIADGFGHFSSTHFRCHVRRFSPFADCLHVEVVSGVCMCECVYCLCAAIVVRLQHP